MSELDKRVVEMQFNNAQFEKDVKQSIKTIDKLDEKLQFKNVSESLNKVKVSFSAFEIATITAITNITNRVVNLGIQLVKSLSIDNISAGWDKFGQKTTAVATMAAQKIRVAGKELTNYSEKMAVITEQLEKLNWFSDETSYNFTDMADNIGKFTAAGRDLDESVNAIMGIATWASLSGQNATTASSAMYQLAQALGRGYIMTQDWRSIETARMATEEFKQTVLDTAVAMGEMTKEGENYISKTGDKISVANFNLASKWFTTDILLASLGKYSAAVERIYEISRETGLTATAVMARYSDELDVFGLKAFKAAQEARTFKDAINSVKDAVSTGWMNTAEKIFGGYDDSKVLWTELANQLYDVFAEGGNFRNEVLGMWNDLAGRADIFGEHGTPNQGAFWNIYDSIIAVKDLIKETWNSIFSISEFSSYSDKVSDLAEKIKSITERVKDFTKRIKDTIENNFELKAIFLGLFSVIKVGVQVIYALVYALNPVVQVIKNIISLLFNRIAAFGLQLTKVDDVINAIQMSARKISDILSTIIEFINPVGILEKFFKFISKIYQTISNVKPLEKAANAVKAFIDAFKGGNSNNIFTKLSSGFSGFLSTLGSKIGSSGINFLDPLYAVIAGLSSLLKGIIAILKPLMTIVGQTFNLLGVILETIGNMISKVINVFNGAEATRLVQVLLVLVSILAPIALIAFVIYRLFNAIQSFINPIKYLLTNISDALYSIGQSFYVKSIARIIESIGLLLLSLAVSMSIIANIPTKNFVRSVITLSVMASVLALIIAILFNITKNSMKFQELADQFKNVMALERITQLLQSLAFVLISMGIVLKIIASIDEYVKVWSSIAAVGAILFEFVWFMKALQGITNTEVEYKQIIQILKSITWTLLVMSVTIKVISSIKELSRMTMAVLAIGIILGMFIGFITVLNSLTNTEVQYKQISQILSSISWTLLVMSATIKVISSIPDIAKVWSSVGAVTVMLLAFIGFVILLNELEKTKVEYSKIIYGLGTLSLILLAIATTIKVMSSIPDIAKVWSSVGAITIILLAFIGFIFLLNKIAATGVQFLGSLFIVNTMAFALVAIGTSLVLVAQALKSLNGVDWSSVGKLALVFLIVRTLGKAGVLKTAKIIGFAWALSVMGTSLAIVAEAMKNLSNADWSSLGKIALIFVIMKTLGKAGVLKSAKIIGFALALSAMGTALAIVAQAMKNLSNADWSSLGKIALIFVLMKTLGKAGVLKSAKIIGFALALGVMGTALSIVAQAMKNLSNADWSSLGKIALIFVLIKTLGKAGILKSAKIIMLSVSLMSMGVALTMISEAMKNFSNVDWSSLGKLSLVFLIVTSLGKSGILKTAKIIMLSVALIALSVGLLFISTAMQSLANVNLKSIGILALLMAVLAGLSLVLKIMNFKGLMTLGIALIPLAMGLSVFALALSLFNNVSWDSVLKGLVSITVALLALGFTVKFLSTSFKDTINMMLIGVSLIVLAGAIAVFALALQLLENVSWSTVGKGAAIVAGGIILLGLAAKIMQPIILSVLGLSAAILMLGLGMLTASVALGLFATNLPLFLESIIGSVMLIAEALTTIGPVLVTAMVDAFKLLFDSLGELVPSIINLIKELLNGLIMLIKEAAGPLAVVIIELIAKILKALVDNISVIFDAVLSIIKSLLKVIADNIADIAQNLIDIVLKIIKVITKNIPEIVKVLIQFSVRLIEVLFDNIGPLIEVLITKVFEFFGKIIPLFLKELIKFTNIIVLSVLVLIANVIKLVLISLGTLSKLFLDLIGGIILLITHTFVGLATVLYQAMRTILYNIFYVLFELLSNLPDDLYNLIGGALKALLGTVVKLIGYMLKGFLSAIGLGGVGDEIIKAGTNMVKDAKASLSDEILSGNNVLNAIKTARNNISNTMGQVMSFITEDVKEGVDQISDALHESVDALTASTTPAVEEAGQEFGNGLVQGIESNNNQAKEAGEELGNQAIEGYVTSTDTESPSKVMIKMGQYFVDGLTTGIDKNSDNVKDSVFAMMNEALAGIESVLDSDMENEFTIRPIMDLSGVSSGAANISSLMNNISGGSVAVSGQLAANVSKRISRSSGLSENQNNSVVNNDGDVYNATFNVVSDNPEEIANEVNIRLQKMRLQSKQAKGGVR